MNPTSTPTETAKHTPAKFTSRVKAEDALDECQRNGWIAGVYGAARNWRIEAHGYTDDRKTRILYILGSDGRMIETGRRAL